MLRIAVLVSGGGTNLQALIDAEKSGIIKNGKIELVLSSKEGVYALERAKNANIKTEVVVRKDYSDIEAYSQKLIDVLKENNIDLIVLAGFMTIISESVSRAFENKIVNVHPALIPSFCGKVFTDFTFTKLHSAKALNFQVQRYILLQKYVTAVP